MSRPKVLMFIEWYLPGFKAGGPIRSCVNLVDHLSSEFEFYIVTGDRDYMAAEPYAGIPNMTWVKGGFGENIMYVKENNLTRSLLKELETVEKFSCIYIHGLFSPVFSIRTQRYFKNKGCPLIVAPRGMLRQGAMSLKSGKKTIFLKLARILGWYRNAIFHATDRQESLDVRLWFGKSVRIIEATNLPRRYSDQMRMKTKEVGSLELVFIGRIAPEKNLIYALELLKKLNREGVRLNIYGAIYDQDYWKKCQELISSMDHGDNMQYMGSVPPEEVLDVLRSHHALLLPTLGENFGHVILESFMAARPVIISSETPWNNLNEEGLGYDLDLTNSAGFLDALESFLELNDFDYQVMCLAAERKYKDFSSDPEIFAASKALFSPRES